MTKFVTISLLVCLAIAMVFVSAMAQDDNSVVVHPYFWDPETPVSKNQNIVLAMTWRACRRGAVQMFLTAVQQNWILDEKPVFTPDVDINQYWGPLFTLPSGGDPADCMGKPPEFYWGTDWEYSIGKLQPGEHTLYFTWWIDHPVTDIADYDGDGKPDLFHERLGEKTTTILVVDE